jgi:hypothetical protein
MKDSLPIIEDLTFLTPTIVPWGWIIGGTLFGIVFLAGLVLLTRLLCTKTRILNEGKAPERAAFHALENAFNRWRETGHLVYLEAVTTALRMYLDGRFGLNASVQTTTQLLKAAQTLPILTATQQGELRDLFVRCDEIKFGSAATRETELTHLYEAACAFVKSTAWRRS